LKKTNDDDNHFSLWTKHGTTYVRMPIAVFIGGVLAIAALTLLVWSVKRKPDARLHVKNAGQLETLMPSLVGLTQSTLDIGNSVQILQNGDGFFPPLLRDMAAARESIHFETFIWHDGKIARRMASLLAQKAKQGVEVRLLVDASGGRELQDEVLEMLQKSGVRVAHFHPVRFSNIGRINNRDHRKIAVIDGRIGYTGGHGVADEWLGNGQDKKHWRDTALRIVGPTVNRLQAAFAENWIEETGEIFAGDRYFPKLPVAGTTPAHVAYTSPSGSIASVQILYYMAIQAARREIIIQNPYLLPQSEAIDALEQAVQRGVDVKIMVPSDDATDSPVVQHASHHRFGNLLKRGVKIWEYDRTLLHQKVIIIDGAWFSVGSTNFDDRSFQLNDEVNVGVIDPLLAAQLQAAFEADLRHARKREFDEWSNRGLWHKTIDGLAYLGHSQF
jgi:cardiolipin synthase A/B